MGPARTSVFVFVEPLGRVRPLVTVIASVPLVTPSVSVSAGLSGSDTRIALMSGAFVAENRSAVLEKTRCLPGGGVTTGRASTVMFTVAGAEGARQVYTGRLVNHAIDGDVETTRAGATTKAAWSAARTEVGVPAHVNLPPPTFLDVIK